MERESQSVLLNLQLVKGRVNHYGGSGNIEPASS